MQLKHYVDKLTGETGTLKKKIQGQKLQFFKPMTSILISRYFLLPQKWEECYYYYYYYYYYKKKKIFIFQNRNNKSRETQDFLQLLM